MLVSLSAPERNDEIDQPPDRLQALTIREVHQPDQEIPGRRVARQWEVYLSDGPTFS